MAVHRHSPRFCPIPAEHPAEHPLTPESMVPIFNARRRPISNDEARMILNQLHQEVIDQLAAESRWSHRCVEGTTYFNKTANGGFNARTLQVLGRAGLIEGQTFTGPRGGRIVGIRLTEAGRAVARRLGGIAEGDAPTDEQGNFIRDVTVGTRTYTIEA
jgi:hypothetical protein